MRKTIVCTFTILLSFFLVSFHTAAQQKPRVTPSGIGYQEYLPDGYHSNNKKYPVVIFLHGYKEKGTSSTDPDLVLRDLPRAAYVGLPKYVKHGKKYTFILISPQLKSKYGTWPPSFIIEVLNHVKKNLRIDEKRIYLTGLSLGGLGVWATAGEYPHVFAAIAPICAGGNAIKKAHAIARENVAVWGFHGGSDRIVSHSVTTNMVNAINAAPKKPNPLAKVTIFPGMGHIIWDKAYNQTDLLDWMLSQSRGSGGGSSGGGQQEEEDDSEEKPETNKPPVANAGKSRSITLPDNRATLTGSASDEDGKVESYRWTKVSGGHATLRDADTPKLEVTDLAEGRYVFRLTVKDDDGASDSDEVTLTVLPKPNQAPAVSAGGDRSIRLPDNELELRAAASDDDGEIKSYAWTKRSGNAVTMRGSNSPTLNLSDMVQGRYVFRVTVEDDQGEKASDEVTVTVYPAQQTQEAEETEEPASEWEQEAANDSEPEPENESGEEPDNEPGPAPSNEPEDESEAPAPPAGSGKQNDGGDQQDNNDLPPVVREIIPLNHNAPARSAPEENVSLPEATRRWLRVQ